MRRLLSTTRTVPTARQTEYLDLWGELRTVVERLGGHAWVFRSETGADRFMEFIEYADDREVAGDRNVAAALGRLEEAFGEGESEAWKSIEDDEA